MLHNMYMAERLTLRPSEERRAVLLREAELQKTSRRRLLVFRRRKAARPAPQPVPVWT
jgi:hypothetical protein